MIAGTVGTYVKILMYFTEFSIKLGLIGDILLLIFGFAWMFWPGFAYYFYRKYNPEASWVLIIPAIAACLIYLIIG